MTQFLPCSILTIELSTRSVHHSQSISKYLDGVERLLREGQLKLPPQLETLSRKDAQKRFLRSLKKKSWVVYSKAPFAGPQKLIDYLSRYTHRVAISNHRLLRCEDGQVTFTYRDRRDADRRKTTTIPAEEFMGRFLKHVLPTRFVRVRHYGLLANRGKHDRLATCRRLLGCRESFESEETQKNAAEWMLCLLGIDINRCPCCGKILHRELIRPTIPTRRRTQMKGSSPPISNARPP